MSVEEHYKRWEASDLVDSFAAKQVADFFESEILFLKKHGAAINSVLDIGCASGRMLELLRQHTVVAKYTGIDIIAANIDRARASFPDASFIVGNALEFDPGEHFDLVNAIGVMQHEPRYEALIERMLAWSRKYVLFDVKFAPVDAPVVDITRSHAGTPEHPLYFILLNYPKFRDFLAGLTGVERIDIYGYETTVNKRTVIPDGVSFVVSACVMMTKGPKRADDLLHVEIPARLSDGTD